MKKIIYSSIAALTLLALPSTSSEYSEIKRIIPKPIVIRRPITEAIAKRLDVKLIESEIFSERVSDYSRNNLIRSIIKAESNNNPWVVSKKGAIGIMQIMPKILKDYNLARNTNYTQEDLFNQKVNYKVGEWYFFEELPRIMTSKELDSDSLFLRLASYNSGAENVREWFYEEGANPNLLNSETKNYIPKIRNDLWENSFKD